MALHLPCVVQQADARQQEAQPRRPVAELVLPGKGRMTPNTERWMRLRVQA
jgi:hypothetical protein